MATALRGWFQETGDDESGPRDMEHPDACYNSARRANEHRGREDPQDWGVFAGGSVTIPQRLDVVEQEHLLPDA